MTVLPTPESARARRATRSAALPQPQPQDEPAMPALDPDDSGVAVDAPADEELLLEWNLLRLLGMYFCLDPKKVRHYTERQHFVDTLQDPQAAAHAPVQIVPHPHYGYPSQGALRVFFALLRKVTGSGYPYPRQIQLSQREFQRLLGRSQGGYQNRRLAQYLLQLRWTVIEARRYDKRSGAWLYRPFSLLSDMYLSGQRHRITACFIELDAELHTNLNAFYGLRFFHNRLESLSAVAKILFVTLYNALSYSYRCAGRRDFFYNKDYGKLIEQWLPTFRRLSYLSAIRKDQLGRPLDELTHSGLLARWAIQRNARRDGFTLYFYPGPAFFSDFERIQASYKPQLRLPLKPEPAPHVFDDPKTLLTYFFGKLYPQITPVIDAFGQRDHEFAQTVLGQLALKEAQDFIDYALDEAAPRTRFTPKTFCGIRHYLHDYLAVRESRQHQQQTRQQAQTEQDYQRYYDETLHTLQQRMPTAVQTDLAAQARQEILAEGDILDIAVPTFIRLRTRKLIGLYYDVPDFTAWQQAVTSAKAVDAATLLAAKTASGGQAVKLTKQPK